MGARTPITKAVVDNYPGLVLPLVFLIVWACPVVCLAEMSIIRVQNRDASSLLPMVETMLSGDGSAFVDTLTNALVVRDNPESLKKIQSFIREMDTPVPQVRIRFRFREGTDSTGSGVGVSGRVSGEGWSVSSGRHRRDGVHVSVRDRENRQERRVESFILVQSGSPAYISVGHRIPFTETWIDLCRRYAHFSQRVRFRTVETGMEVKPLVTGDRVLLDITPRVSYEIQGSAGVIRFAQASTRLHVQKGQWVSLGGHSRQSNEVMRHMFSAGVNRTRNDLSLEILVQ